MILRPREAAVAARASSDVPDWITPMLAKPDGGWLRAGPESGV